MSDEVTDRTNGDPASTSWQYPFSFSAALTVEPVDPASVHSGYVCRPERIFAAATPAWGLSQEDLAAVRSRVPAELAARAVGGADRSQGSSSQLGVGTAVGSGTNTPRSIPALAAAVDAETISEGVAEAFVELLRHETVLPVPGFRVVRLVPPPEASGERPVLRESEKDSVVVGERVVVTWMRHVQDGDHAAPATLSHLDAVGFLGVPETYGILLWRTPCGREVPVAWATKYLPRARDGWDWCVDLTQQALGLDAGGPRDPWAHDFPARLGRLVAKLHLALATPSKVLPEPTAHAQPDLVRAWHSVAKEALGRAIAVAESGTLEGAADVLLPRAAALTATVDGLLAVAEEIEKNPDGPGGVVVQRVHGDMHLGQVLRWSSGLAVVDFHPDPALEYKDLRVGQVLQPAARDLARLLRSLDHAGRVADKSSGFTATHDVDRWSALSRTQLLDAYRAELAAGGHPELLDERLLAPFEAEQLCREIAYAADHLPSWAYAPLGGLWQEFPSGPPREAGPDGTTPRRGPRGRHALPASEAITRPVPLIR